MAFAGWVPIHRKTAASLEAVIDGFAGLAVLGDPCALPAQPGLQRDDEWAAALVASIYACLRRQAVDLALDWLPERRRRREQIGRCLLSAIASHDEDHAATGVSWQLRHSSLPQPERWAEEAGLSRVARCWQLRDLAFPTPVFFGLSSISTTLIFHRARPHHANRAHDSTARHVCALNTCSIRARIRLLAWFARSCAEDSGVIAPTASMSPALVTAGPELGLDLGRPISAVGEHIIETNGRAKRVDKNAANMLASIIA